MAHGISHDRRLTLLRRAAQNRRAVRIIYRAVAPCPSQTTDERTIEIHNVQCSADGNWVIDAWCRSCAKRERFRLDRIRSHRTLRSAYKGPSPKVTPEFVMSGRVHVEELRRPITATPTAEGLLAGARARIAKAAAFRSVFGPHEHYQPRPVPTTDDLLAAVPKRLEKETVLARTRKTAFGTSKDYTPSRAPLVSELLAGVRHQIDTAKGERP